MIKSVLIIDDERVQAEGIAKAFSQSKPDFVVNVAFEEKDILDKIENLFFNVAIVDLRMDKFMINGFEIIRRIVEVNPFSRIIIVSAWTAEYLKELRDIVSSGKIHAIVEKKDFDQYIQEIFEAAEDIVDVFDSKELLNSKSLIKIYAHSKLEVDRYKKGKLFEDFVILLFASMGFKHIYNRIRDVSLNEIDLAIRNDIEDSFLSRFGKYIFVECKNKPDGAVNKNDFIVFLSKVQNSNGLSKFGVLITSGYITSNTYHEAIRDSKSDTKIMFISNPEIERILQSDNFLSTFKYLIDSQVKDN